MIHVNKLEKKLLLPLHDDINTTWWVFKQELRDRILQFIPKMNSTWKEDGQTTKISNKNCLWTCYMETRDKTVFKKYKSVRKKIRNEMCKLQRLEQRSVATQCKQNPKAFWKYINSKRKSKIGIVNSVDEHGNPVMVSINTEKAKCWAIFSRLFLKFNWNCYTTQTIAFPW